MSISVIFCIDEIQLAENDYVSSSHFICKEICVDFYFKEKPYIGLHWMISHNLFISSRTSLINSINGKKYLHNLYGFDMSIIDKEKYKIILSFDLNKSFYHEDGNYGWYQTSIIYSRNINRSNLQIILDSIYNDNWNSRKINLIYGFNIHKNISLNFGIISKISGSNKDFSQFITLNFNI